MWNLMKAQNYQARRDNFVIYVILLGAIMLVGMTLLESPVAMDELNGGLFLVTGGELWSMPLSIIVILLVPRLTGWDMVDKTINYEVMTGHSRSKVYFSRALVSLSWIMGIVVVLLAGGIGTFTLLNGWGNNVDAVGALQRVLLVLFPVFRLSCEMFLLTVLLKNCYLAMVIGWGLTGATMMLCLIYMEAIGEVKMVSLALLNIMQLLIFDNYKLQFIGGEDIPVFETALESGFALETMVVSLVVGVICLLVGYIIFRKRDMD